MSSFFHEVVTSEKPEADFLIQKTAEETNYNHSSGEIRAINKHVWEQAYN